MNNMIDSCVSKGRGGFYDIPQMIYGLELVYLSRRDEKMLESTHSSVARIVQGLPNHIEYTPEHHNMLFS